MWLSKGPRHPVSMRLTKALQAVQQISYQLLTMEGEIEHQQILYTDFAEEKSQATHDSLKSCCAMQRVLMILTLTAVTSLLFMSFSKHVKLSMIWNSFYCVWRPQSHSNRQKDGKTIANIVLGNSKMIFLLNECELWSVELRHLFDYVFISLLAIIIRIW